MYSDGLMVLGAELSATQVEASAADIKDYVMPYPGQIEGMGLYITENFSAHNTTDPIVKLQSKTSLGGSATDLVAVTLGSSASLKKGDGSKVAQTAITADADLLNGHVVFAKQSAFPIKIAAGQIITLRHATAADGAGGAYIPVVLFRVAGEDMAAATSWLDTAA